MPAQNNPWDMSKSSPASAYEVVTPVDSADLTNIARSIFVGAAGNMKFETSEGDIVTVHGLLAGQVYPFGNISKVFSGTTTAASLVALR